MPTLPLIFASALGLRPSAWLMLVPSLSQHFMVTGLLRAEPVSVLYATLSVSVSLALGIRQPGSPDASITVRHCWARRCP